jgi:lytic murein transglycosylase
MTMPAEIKCARDYNNDFRRWLEDVRREAAGQGISNETWAQALPYLTYNPAIIQRDRAQGGFYKSFLEFSLPRVHTRLTIARRLLKQHADLFKRVEAKYGVPGEIILAFWGMETDFASGPGKKVSPVLTSAATLAFDCRRPELFRPNLIDALRLIENRDIEVDQFLGEWAGEMGGLQFTPSNFWKYAVDFDGDGRRDVVSSIPDMIASAASVLKDYGWRAGQPYLQEVSVPDQMPWEQADLTATTQLTRGQWARMGVTAVNGSPLPNDGLPASLMLPMGHLGPAFLAYPNFKVLLKWNASLNNALTAGYFGIRLANPRAGAMSPGKETVTVLSAAEIKELQTLLKGRGYDIAKIDGIIGTGTRAAVKDVQLRLQMPADAYPTPELLERLR